MSKCLVAGGAGFIGSNLADELINAAQGSVKSAAVSKKRDVERQAASSK